MTHLMSPERVIAARAAGGVGASASQGLTALTRVAAALLRTPAAYVTILDDARQQIIAAHETSAEFMQAPFVSLQQSVCRLVIERGDLLVLDDISDSPAAPIIDSIGSPVRAYLGVPLADADRQLIGVLCVTDVVPRDWSDDDCRAIRDLALAAESEVRRALLERRYQLAMQATGEVLYAFDLDSQSAWREGALQQLFGNTATMSAGAAQAWTERLHPEDRERVLRERAEAINGTLDAHVSEYRIVRSDDQVLDVRDEAWIQRDDQGRAVQVVGRMADITTERRAVELLRNSERLLRQTLETIHDGIVVQDAQDRILLANPAAGHILGLSEDQLFGRSSYDPDWCAMKPDGSPFVPEEHPSVIAMRTGEPKRGVEMRVARPDGTQAWISIDSQPMRAPESGAVTAVLTTFRDITRERQLHAELLQAQKLEAMGRLTGGIAHDFNNLLTVIGGCAELLVDALPDGNDSREDALEIRRTVERAQALTRQLLAFSRREPSRPRAVGLAGLLRNSAMMLRRVVPINASLSMADVTDDPIVVADPGQLEQVLMNLVVNAVDALPYGGHIRVQVAHGTAGERPAAAPMAPVFDAPHVVLSVADDGAGMPESVRQRAFDPFFTTKPAHKGTGLGLSTIWGIIAQAGGTCWIESTPSVGTTVYVALPEDPAESVPVTARAADAVPLAPV